MDDPPPIPICNTRLTKRGNMIDLILAQQMSDVVDAEVQKLMPALYIVAAFMVLVFGSFIAVVWKLTRDNKESRETFLGHIRHMADAQGVIEHDRSQSLKELGENCHAFQRDLAAQTRGVFGEVTQALHLNTKALGANTETLHAMASIIERRMEKT